MVSIKRMIKKNKLLFLIFLIITLVIYICLNNVIGCFINLQESLTNYSQDTVSFEIEGAVNNISYIFLLFLKHNYLNLQFS